MPSITDVSSLQHGFFVITACSTSKASIEHFSASEKIATSIKVSPQKCFSIVNDNVENNTKNDKATEKVLCAIENFTAQSYKIIEEYVPNYKTLNDLV